MTLPSDLATPVDALTEERVDWRFKGFPAPDVAASAVAAQGWSLLDGDLLLPMLVLKERALEHNLELMGAFCRSHGVQLAPHGKTTMAPQLFRRQLDAGAWAITVATVSQARVARAFGVRRIVVANEVVEPAAVRWLADELDGDERFDCYCLVDSQAGVERMAAALAGRPAARELPVLVEVGVVGGRAGCRTVEGAVAVAEAVARSDRLRLAGVEAFEGILPSAGEVDEFLARVRATALELAARGLFDDLDEVVVSAGGSTFFDRVVAQLSPLELGRPVRLVLRSGGYLTHDSGFYERSSPFGSRSEGDRLEAALEAWGVVLSRPEAGLAIVGFGKRDVPYDVELPVPLHTAREGVLAAAPAGLEVVGLNDQHGYVRVPEGADLAVGDLLGCGISHPCTAFDKWALIALVDDGYRVTGTLRTFF
jgi:D-serine deaminase-like pyridoxal phosphate-dependent protein